MENATQPYAGDTTTSPIVIFLTASVISCILSVGIMISRIPGPVPLWGSVLWLCIAAALTTASAILILMKKPFAPKVFFKIAKWTFLYFLVISSMGEYVIIFNGTRGSTLVVMTITILLFLVNIPMLWGFSVARHERTSD
jgi:hypothetical protein